MGIKEKGEEKREKSSKKGKGEGKGGKWVNSHAWPSFESKIKGLSNNAWVSVEDYGLKGPLGSLKFCLVRSWITIPYPFPSMLEVESWARFAWRLKGSIMVAPLYQDLLFMEFSEPEDVK